MVNDMINGMVNDMINGMYGMINGIEIKGFWKLLYNDVQMIILQIQRTIVWE